MPAASRYRLVRRLGQGGAAEVFEAYLTSEGGFERRVAVKRLLEDQSNDESALSSFQDEARIASQLHHANIAGVIDYGVQDGQPFIAMEFVDGLDCGRLYRLTNAEGVAIPPVIALHITTEIAHALDHAHEAVDAGGRRMELVHRDVSPENILVSWAGDVKLTDFGIARAVHRLEQTRVGIAKGKLNYMAPEQVRAASVDARADLFALGCVLHALLTGESVIQRDHALSTVHSGVDPQLDRDVAEIVERATASAPRDRYRSARELAAASGTALARRLTKDARSTMREWIAPFAQGAVRTPRRTPGDLLDVELLLLGDAGGVRRFGSRIASPGEGPSARGGDERDLEEATRATQVDPRLHARLGREAETEATAAGATFVRREPSDTDDTGPTALPDTAIAADRSSVARALSSPAAPQPSPFSEPERSLPPALGTPPPSGPAFAGTSALRISNTGPLFTPRQLGGVGLVMGAIALVTFLITLSVRSKETVVEVAPVALSEPRPAARPAGVEPSAEPARVPSAAPRPSSGREEAPEGEAADDPRETTAQSPQPCPPGTVCGPSAGREATVIGQRADRGAGGQHAGSAEPKRPALRAPTSAEQHSTLARALHARGLGLDDLDEHDPPLPELDAWRRTLGAGELEEAHAALRGLLGRVSALEITPAMVKKRIARVAVVLERASGAASVLPRDEQQALERRYFELRARLRPQSSAAECEVLARELDAFARELQAKLAGR